MLPRVNLSGYPKLIELHHRCLTWLNIKEEGSLLFLSPKYKRDWLRIERLDWKCQKLLYAVAWRIYAISESGKKQNRDKINHQFLKYDNLFL
jgi:hypothetical protein